MVQKQLVWLEESKQALPRFPRKPRIPNTSPLRRPSSHDVRCGRSLLVSRAINVLVSFNILLSTSLHCIRPGMSSGPPLSYEASANSTHPTASPTLPREVVQCLKNARFVCLQAAKESAAEQTQHSRAIHQYL